MTKRYIAQAGILIDGELLVVSCSHEHYRLEQAFRCSVELGKMGTVSLVRAVNPRGGKPLDLSLDEREAVKQLADGLSIVRRDCAAFTLLVFK
jgi:hypothetical protein